MNKQINTFVRFGNIAAYIMTLIVNGLAGTTMLGGRTTAQVSDLYANPFTPAGYVFSIWGIIYTLLAIFVIYQALPKQKDKAFQKQIGFLFILSSILNVTWLFLWQFDYIIFSVILMVALLTTLAAIYLKLGIGVTRASKVEQVCVRLPFSVYFGWITVALIANVAAAFVSIGWYGLGLGAEIWAIAAMIIALTVTIVVIVLRRDVAYSLVVVWALAGIAVKQNTYSNIVLTSLVGIAVIIVVLFLKLAMFMFWEKRKSTREQ